MSTTTIDSDEVEPDYAVDALFGEQTFQSLALHYGPSLILTTATQTGKSLTLLANAVFNSALVFAEWIDRGLLDIPEKASSAFTRLLLKQESSLKVLCQSSNWEQEPVYLVFGSSKNPLNMISHAV